MASLRIVGIDPVTSGSNQLAAQGLDTVLINDIHGSTALNLVSTSGTIDLFTGGTAVSNAVLSLGTGSATFNPNSQAAFNGVTIESGTGSVGLQVSSPATTNRTTLIAKQLGTAPAFEVFGTGLAILQMGDSGTFLYNKTDSDMDLYTSGAGLLTLNSGATGGTAITVDANSAGQGADITLTAGASTSGANAGGPISLTGGSTNSTGAFDSGGVVTLTGGASTNAAQGGPASLKGGSSTSGGGGTATVLGGTGSTAGGSAFLSGGTSSNGSNAGGNAFVTAGDNSVSSISDNFGSLYLGASTTKDINVGGVSNAGIPGAITVTGQGTTGGGSSAGGNVSVTAGSTNGTALGVGGTLTLNGGPATAAAVGGPAFLTGGSSSSGSGGFVSITGGAGNIGGDASLAGGVSSNAAQSGGSVTVAAGGNSASAISDHFGSISIGVSTTRDITFGGVSNSGVPGTITVTGQGTTGANSGGAISVVGGTTTDVNSAGGSVSLSGGTGAKPGGLVTVTGGTCSVSGNLGGAVAINGGTNSVSAISDNFGSITIGTATTKNIDIGGVSNSGVPGTITVTGQSTTANTFGGSVLLVGGDTSSTTGTDHGGSVNLTGGASSSSASGGKVSLTGGSSSLGTGGAITISGGPAVASTAGTVSLLGGSTTSVVSSGGSVIIDAGYSSSSGSPDYMGSIDVGTSLTGSITIGGTTSIVKSASGTAPGLTISGFNHGGGSINNLANGGSVIIAGGAGSGQILAGAYASGGSLLLDPGSGAGGGTLYDGIISLFSQTGDTLSIGDGTVIPKVKIRDGYLSFTDTTSTSDSNTSSGLKNSLYAKNTPEAWIIAFGTSIQDSFGISSIVASGLGVAVTFLHTATSWISQCFLATGHPSTSPFFLTASSFTPSSVLIRAWNTSGVEVNMWSGGGLVWQIFRMAEIA